MAHYNIIEKFVFPNFKDSVIEFYFESLKYAILPFSLEKNSCNEEIKKFKEEKSKKNSKSIGKFIEIRKFS